ncbi:ribonuclease HI [Bartonella sp. DGB1]|uniref:ribonuclease HI n=1 Tax=Bartonella sp. DGB1 TaxID=3239807 RepID=UPI003523C490
MTKQIVTIYSDGACSGNPGIGGWGAVLLWGEHQKYISGAEDNTTNNRMELMAAIEALNNLKKPCTVELYTDSTYLRKGVMEWINNWKTNGWKTASKKEVKNKDLWQQLDDISSKHKISWYWVKGHNGNLYNEKADELARKAIVNFKNK